MIISFSPFWSQSALTVRFVLNTRDLIQDLLTLAKEFNHTVTVDLKPYKGVHFLHLIHLAARHSNSVVIHSKGKEVICEKHHASLDGNFWSSRAIFV